MTKITQARLHPRFKDEKFWDVVDKETQKALVAEQINSGAARGAHRSTGRLGDRAIVSEMVRELTLGKDKGGGLDYFDFPAQRKDPAKSIVREMIDTAQGQMALLEKVRIDVAFGLADIPLLYGPLYESIAPAGGFPGGLYQVDEFLLQANVVFQEKFEGGEVQFGTLAKGSPSVGKISTYAAGFEWTEDMIEFDRTWNIELNNQAFGRAWNAMRNHLYLSPIIGYDYATFAPANITPANATGATFLEQLHLTLQAAYRASVLATPRRTATVLLASEADRFDIEAAILTPVYDASGNPLPNVPIQTIIYYDGDEIDRGSDVFDYPGVTPGTCFLAFPQRKLKELIHHDLRIDIGPADLSRLVEGQQVGRARVGVFANLEESIQKVVLPVA